ncbi:MAG TPA: hypothetical protein VEZ40_17515 [Pyrinomonadaceae bacterium]|nr:hypothetical protein [Pyrinomonadaceae bacterium]
MATDSLDDEMVKLVSYTIVSVKRGHERIMPGGMDTLVVTDSLSKEAFISWVVARYLQSQAYAALDRSEKLSHGDRKYLRVDYAVSRRWPREPLEFEERQIEVLEQISNALAETDDDAPVCDAQRVRVG